jgi:hypothetical protein
MKQLIPLLIIGVSFAIFLALRTAKRSEEAKPSLLRKIWRRIVAIFDFITNFG